MTIEDKQIINIGECVVLDNYEGFKDKVFALTKIDLNAYKERQMKRRIDALIDKHKVKSYAEYVDEMRKDRTLLEEFVNYLTINVSEFWRNPDQWSILEKDIIPELLKHSSYLKIWSAACSTGDEPYSLAMLLSKFMPLNRIKILATDIDKQVLDKARAGLYNVKSLKGLPPEFVKKFFTEITPTSFQINDEIKKCVEFKTHDLLKDTYPISYDLILCRNVLIYFTDDAKDIIFKKFHSALRKEGILFLGSTEQIISPGDIGFKNLHSFFYQAL